MLQAEPTPTYKALVLDDNFFNRDLFRIALENAGYTVTEIEDAVEGCELLKSETFHLMILDLFMPKMNGGAILEIVRNQTMHDKMHIVVVTADAHRATSTVDEMADFVMLKPINVVEFAAFAHRLQTVLPMRAKTV
jgi:CheY-like chemotaxis protein